jgi:hypothetical protein
MALVEVLVTAAILATVAAGMSHVTAIAIRATATARMRTAATLAAVQKMEQLRALVWSEITDEETGSVAARSDLMTDLSTDPETASGYGLAPSPSGTLDGNVAKYVDHLDGDGRWVGNGVAPPLSAVYTRRWAIQPLAADPDNTRVLIVRVSTSRDPAARDARPQDQDAVLLVCVKTRTSP